MTEWLDSSAFFFPPEREDGEIRLLQIARTQGFLPGDLKIDEHSSAVSHDWSGLPARVQVLGSPIGKILTISYFSAEFQLDVARRPGRWRKFCQTFGRACVELSPLAAVAFGIPSDDVVYDVRRYELAVAEGDGTWLRAQSYALLYLCPDLDQETQFELSTLKLPGYILNTGGRITSGPDYYDYSAT